MTYRSLLPAGFLDISEADLDNHFLSAFPNSQRRPLIIDGLRRYLHILHNFGIDFEIWVDGSFTTDKLEPSDVDLVALAPSAALQNLPAGAQQQLKTLFIPAITKQTFYCDAYLCLADDQKARSYWRGWFGYDRDEKPKGIARLVLHT